jgi:serine/threonine protein kinase
MTATEGRKAAAQRAINELDKLVGMVVQQVNKPSINYRGDAARFAQVLKTFHLAVRGSGLTLEFPWASLDEAEGAMKAKASGRGSYAIRRAGVTSAVQPLREALEAARDGDDVTVLHLEQDTWDLGAPLGVGGFARVYEATNGAGDRAVAKLIPKQPGAARELLFEDLSEARNVVPILDRGEHGDSWVLVMPRAQRSLADRIRDDGPLSIPDALIVMRDVGEALEDLQDTVVHRDIKPDNILLLDGRWCLADFGIARYAEASTAPDTRKHALSPQYASPEQWAFQHATPAADVYALGGTIFAAITGTPPFPGPSTEDYRDQHTHDDPPALTHVPAALASLIAECLFKAPGARPTPTQILARAATVPAAPANPGLAALQQANLAEVQRAASKEQANARAETEQERRERLLQAGTHTFSHLLAELAEAVAAAAPAAQITRGPQELIIALGAGKLAIDDLSSTESYGWPGTPFDVIAKAFVSITQPANRSGYTGRSHSLWYADAQQQGHYRWYETAFMINPLANRGMRQEDPFCLPPNGTAHEAIAPGITTTQLAWPFTPLMAGALDAWISEWSLWLAQASNAAMQIPTHMPERNPAGSWRVS